MAIKLARTSGSRVALGLGFAAVACTLGLFLSGGGHGWNTPLLVSVILWVVAPVTLYVINQSEPPRPLLYILVAIALIADFILIKGTIIEAEVLPRYAEVNGASGLIVMATWTFLWALWQVLVVRALLTSRAEASSD
jgi:hypothetical protein